MNNTQKRVLISAFLSIGVGVAYYLFSKPEVVSEPVAKANQQKIEVEEPIKPVVQPKIPAKESKPEFLTEELLEQVSGIVDYYEAQSRYPVFSTPVLSQESLQIPEPFEVTEVDTPLFDENGEELTIKVSAAVDKYKYFVGDQIILRLNIGGLEENQSISATASLKQPGSAIQLMPSLIELEATKPDFSAMETRFDTNLIDPQHELGDLIVRVDLQIEDDVHVTTVPLVLSKSPPARLENLGLASVDGSFLDIPMEFSVTRAGYYFVQTYLYDQKSNLALLSLQTQGNLREGNDTLSLKAHVHALKDAGSEGPYYVKVHRIYKAVDPKLNETSTANVSFSESNSSVAGFSFDNYVDEPYVDEQTQRRIAALRELAEKPQSK